MTKDQVESILQRAKTNFLQNHTHLLDVSSSERSITHQFAIELTKDRQLLEWNIDCEYSRNGDVVKRINIETVNNFSSDLSPKIVYPDIIVHKRYPKQNLNTRDNLIVIEAKKNDNDTEYDLKKLKGYLTTLNYQFAVMLTFNCNDPKDITWKIWSFEERNQVE